MPHALSPMLSALCSLLYALCPMPYALSSYLLCPELHIIQLPVFTAFLL